MLCSTCGCQMEFNGFIMSLTLHNHGHAWLKPLSFNKINAERMHTPCYGFPLDPLPDEVYGQRSTNLGPRDMPPTPCKLSLPLTSLIWDSQFGARDMPSHVCVCVCICYKIMGPSWLTTLVPKVGELLEDHRVTSLPFPLILTFGPSCKTPTLLQKMD